jgi:hypothetical protein
MNAPILEIHRGITVVRDDLFPGGTKARFIGSVFDGATEAVYASPPEGGAQTALATVAKALGKRATIFVAQRAKPHARPGPFSSRSVPTFRVRRRRSHRRR